MTSRWCRKSDTDRILSSPINFKALPGTSPCIQNPLKSGSWGQVHSYSSNKIGSRAVGLLLFENGFFLGFTHSGPGEGTADVGVWGQVYIIVHSCREQLQRKRVGGQVLVLNHPSVAGQSGSWLSFPPDLFYYGEDKSLKGEMVSAFLCLLFNGSQAIASADYA